MKETLLLRFRPISAIALILTAVSAFAQSVDETPSPQSVSPPLPEGAVVLDTIIVTGEKLGRNLKDTTTSASVFGANNIEDQGDDSLNDLLRRAANTAAQEEGAFSIRGVSQAGAGGGTGAPLISVQVDGVTLDSTSQEGATTDLFDVEQVEVLRGAQSTSQGRNALAGAVVITTREPTREWEGKVRTQMAERGGRELAAAGGGPLSDSLAFRLTASKTNDDGFITHVPDGNEKFARKQNELLRGKLAFTPLAWPGFESLFTLGTNRSDGQPDYNIERGEAGSDPAQRRTSAVSEPTRDLVDTDTASLRNTLKWGDHYSFTAITSGLRTHQDYLRDYDGLEEPDARNDIHNEGRNLTQELRLNVKDWKDRISGAVGLYSGRFKDNYLSLSTDVRATLAEAAALPLPVGGDLVELELDFVNETLNDARNFAAFTEFDLKATDKLTATLGLRYDQEELQARSRFATTRAEGFVATPQGLQTIPLVGQTLSDVLALLPGIDVLPVLVAANQVPDTGGLQGGKTKYSALLPKLGLRYAVSPEWSVFATYAEAYRAGGVDVDTTNGQTYPFDPEFTKNYELGLRGELPDSNLDVAANLFYTNWRDQQVPVLRGFFFVTQNAGRSQLYGAETAVGWKPVQRLRVQAGLGLVNTEFLEYRDGDTDFAGNEFVFAPRTTASIGGTWHFADQWILAANLSHRSKSFTSPANAEDERSEERQLLDMRLGYESERFGAYLFGRNLLNQDYITETYQFREGYIGGPTPRGYAAYGAPRTFGAQLELRL